MVEIELLDVGESRWDEVDGGDGLVGEVDGAVLVDGGVMQEIQAQHNNY